MQIDLHLHSYYSDGECSPYALAEMAARLGLDAVSLTDHDTDAGTEEFTAAALERGLKVLRGIELSAHMNVDVHILGYNCPLSVENAEFGGIIKTYRARRIARLHRIIDRLNGLGIEITYNDIESEGDRTPTRVRVAERLVAQKIVPDVRTAFSQYLGKNKAAWVPSSEMRPQEVVSVITRAGGQAVLAHPGRYRYDERQMESLVASLKEEGLIGIESYYPTHTTEEVKRFVALSRKYGLINTAGSDFHRLTGDRATEMRSVAADPQTVQLLGL